MNRFLALGVALAALLMLSAQAQAQYVSMTGEWYSHNGAEVNIPYNPPVIPCTPGIGGACITKKTPLIGTANNKPSYGIPATRTIMGGVGIGDPFEIEPDSFNESSFSRFGAIAVNFGVQQINTRFTFQGPPAERMENPPPNTRQFAANAWTLPGNGQTGRVASNTTPMTPLTNGAGTIRYTGGARNFGGTMHMLIRGPGEIYLNGIILGTSSFPTSVRPLIGIVPIGNDTPADPWRNRPAGIGWGHTAMGTQGAGVVRGGAAYAPPCTIKVPPLPAGCELVINTGFTDLFPLSTATSVIHGFAFTTGMVTAIRTGTEGGAPATMTLLGNGYDTTTPGGVRNIAMVAGSMQIRTDLRGVGHTPTMAVVELSFVPEPASTTALAIGIAAIGLFHYRRSRG